MKPLAKAFTVFVAIVWIIAACCADSASNIPTVVMAVSMLYLVIVGKRYGAFDSYEE